MVNERCAQITLKKILDRQRPNLNSSLIIGTFLLAESRIYMHRILTAIYMTKNCQLLYVDVDGIIFRRPRNIMPKGLTVGYSFGDMKPVFEGCEVEAVCILAPKCYSVLLKDSRGDLFNEIKVAGLNLKYQISQGFLSHQVFETLFDEIRRHKAIIPISIPQLRRKRLVSQKIIIERTARFFYAKMYEKRYVKPETFDTFPYGLNEEKKNYSNTIVNLLP